MESEDKQNRTKRTWKSLIYDFAASSTAHGIGRIAAGDTLLKRGTWIVICLAVYAALFWFCSVLIVQYMNKPVITKVEMAFEEVSGEGLRVRPVLHTEQGKVLTLRWFYFKKLIFGYSSLEQ